MYQFSRAMFRDLAPLVSGPGPACQAQLHVLQSCEQAVERLATDRRYFARPTRTLFNDVRSFFPMAEQRRVYVTIERHLELAQAFFTRQALHGYDVNGDPLQCRATTRKGKPCQRVPLPLNGYCPSHQHLAETEDLANLGAAAAMAAVAA